MIGVDIIDRKAILPRTAEKIQRYRNKIMLSEEQKCLDAHFDLETAMWVAWSLKESVYKLEYKQKAIRYFRPKSIEVQSSNQCHSNEFKFTLKGRFGDYTAKVELNDQYIQALALASSIALTEVYVQSFFLEATDPISSSTKCREKLNSYLNDQFSQNSIMIIEDEYPRLVAEKGWNYDLSISHHAHWGCFALQKC